ncbi:hypothetical protein ACFL5C_03265, partial [Candidatus Omnitrophota bacterium]
TAKEYPESNISMQEAMFIPLSAQNYEDSQEMTVKLQNRLKEIIENAEGCRVMGIGLEGGLAPYITKEEKDIVPEQRLWRMAKQAIVDCGYVPGVDVAIALDPAASELEIAYREANEQPDAVGMYLFWRDKENVVMSRDELFELYRKTIEEDGIPIVSIEDGFAEDDDAGWALIMKNFGDKIFIIGDDSVTTRDSSIEHAADNNLNNTFLCKANQIGTLSETLLAILVAFGKDLEIVVSHRSKSPNDDMEAQIALAAFTMGLKAGGGANTERLFKYGSIMRVMAEAVKEARSEVEKGNTEMPEASVEDLLNNLTITNVFALEEATNAGIPTVGVSISFGVKGSKRFKNLFTFTGATPLGTSAGTGEAIHLVDSVVYRNQIPKAEYLKFFKQTGDGSYRFKKEVTLSQIKECRDSWLTKLYRRAERYGGKGCLNAVDHVNNILAPMFEGMMLSDLTSLASIDSQLLDLEKQQALEREQITSDSTKEEQIEAMQRKGNIGMNAILSQSLALARLMAHMQGKELWEVLRETLAETMAKTIAANGGLGVLPERLQKKVTKQEDQFLWQALAEQLSFEELKQGLRSVNNNKSEGVKLYELLRKELPVYESDKAQARDATSRPVKTRVRPRPVINSKKETAAKREAKTEERTMPKEFVSSLATRVINFREDVEQFTYHLWNYYDRLDQEVAGQEGIKLSTPERNVVYTNIAEMRAHFIRKIVSGNLEAFVKSVFHGLDRDTMTSYIFRSSVIAHLAKDKAQEFFKEAISYGANSEHGYSGDTVKGRDNQMARIYAHFAKNDTKFASEAILELNRDEKDLLLGELKDFYINRDMEPKAHDDGFASFKEVLSVLNKAADRDKDFDGASQKLRDDLGKKINQSSNPAKKKGDIPHRKNDGTTLSVNNVLSKALAENRGSDFTKQARACIEKYLKEDSIKGKLKGKGARVDELLRRLKEMEFILIGDAEKNSPGLAIKNADNYQIAHVGINRGSTYFSEALIKDLLENNPKLLDVLLVREL